MREIYVADSDRRARAEGEFHWKNFWERRGGGRTYGAHGATGLATILDGTRRQELMNMEHSIAEGSFSFCGSPETVAPQIKKIAGEAGADTFLGEFTFGELISAAGAQLATALHRAGHAGAWKVRDRRAEFSHC